MQQTYKTKLFKTAYVLFSVLCDVTAVVLSAMLFKNNCTCIACMTVLFAGAVCMLHGLSLLLELVTGRPILARIAKTLKFSAAVILAVSAMAKLFLLPYTEWYGHSFCVDFARIPSDNILYMCTFLTIVSYLFFDKKHRLPMCFSHIAVVPCFLVLLEKTIFQNLSAVCAFVLSAYVISFIFSVINGNRLNAFFSLIKLALGK